MVFAMCHIASWTGKKNGNGLCEKEMRWWLGVRGRERKGYDRKKEILYIRLRFVLVRS